MHGRLNQLEVGNVSWSSAPHTQQGIAVYRGSGVVMTRHYCQERVAMERHVWPMRQALKWSISYVTDRARTTSLRSFSLPIRP
jgi:hypothetical protein